MKGKNESSHTPRHLYVIIIKFLEFFSVVSEELLLTNCQSCINLIKIRVPNPLPLLKEAVADLERLILIRLKLYKYSTIAKPLNSNSAKFPEK